MPSRFHRQAALWLGAAGLASLACTRRPPPEGQAGDSPPAGRRLAAPSAFDLVPASSGGALAWVGGSPAALHVESIDALGRAAEGGPMALAAGADAADVAAVALGSARVVAWSEADAEGRRLRAVWLPESGAERAFDLGAVGTGAPLARGGIAMAASGQGVRLFSRGAPTACASANEPPCRAFQFFAIEADGARPVGAPLAVPSPCAAYAAQLVPGSGRSPSDGAEPFEYAVCSEERARSALTVFSIHPSPAYAAAEEVFAGCTPLGAARFAGQSAFVARCGDERRLARLDGATGAPSIESLEPRGVVCGAAGANVRLGAGWLRLAEPLGGLELLLGDDLAPPGSRAIWAGSALLVARPAASGELVLARHACRGTALVELEDARSLEGEEGSQKQ